MTVRGWKDELAKAEAAYADKNQGKKLTSAEIVQGNLKGKHVVVADTVKIVSQKEVEDCIVEFAIRMEFAPHPSVVKVSEKRGARE